MPQLSRIPVQLADVTAVARDGAPVSLTSVVERDLAASHALFEAARAEGMLLPPHDDRIATDLSDESEERAAVFARLVSMTRGGSGIHPGVSHEHVFALNNRHRLPVPTNAAAIGVAALVVDDLVRLVNASDFVVALSVSALRASGAGGSASPFSAQVQSAHRSHGQAASAARIRAQLTDADVTSVDPAAFRSAPQVNGALADAVTGLAAAVTLELNSRGDETVVDLETESVTVGGNSELVALTLAIERVRLALAHVGAASESRAAELKSEPNADPVIYFVNLPRPEYSADVLGTLRLMQISLAVTLSLLSHEAEVAAHICSADEDALTPQLRAYGDAVGLNYATDALLAAANPAPSSEPTIEALDDEI